jgi:GTP-binding protein EngB required for normal cell division
MREETKDSLPEQGSVSAALDRLEEAARLLERSGVTIEVAEARKQLVDQLLEVAVVGEFKRGKSTLINALVGREVLPVGVLPLTTVPTVLERGEPGCEVHFGNGRSEQHPLDAVERFVSEERNPGNRMGVEIVVVRLHSPILDEGVRIVDTPGVGSIFGHSTVSTAAYLPALDAAVLVISADPPISEGEVAFLKDVLEHAVELFVVLNKADYLSDRELERTVEFTNWAIKQVWPEWTGRVYPLSARRGAGDPEGLERFRRELERFLREERARVVITSVRRSMLRTASLLELELGLETSAAATPLEELRDKHASFQEVVHGLRDEIAADEALIQAALRRALEELDRFSEARRGALEEAADRMTVRTAAELVGAPPAELFYSLRSHRADMLARIAVETVAEASDLASATFERALQPVLDRSKHRLDRLGRAAADTFGVALPSLEVPDISLGPGKLRFSRTHGLDSAEQVRLSWLRLRGSRGRRRSLELGRREARAEIPALLGRLRGELLEQLSEQARTASRRIRTHESELAERLSQAVQRGAALIDRAERERRERQRELGKVGALLSEVRKLQEVAG